MGGFIDRFFPLAVEDLSCPLTELPRSPRGRLRPPPEAAESVKVKVIRLLGILKSKNGHVILQAK